MSDALEAYYEALERLKKGRSVHVSKGTKITNDAVSIEAGRGKGTIKKSRPVFADLIAAIDTAASEQASSKDALQEKVEKVKAEANRYRSLWEEGLAREISLLQELLEVRKTLARVTGENVLPLKKPERKT